MVISYNQLVEKIAKASGKEAEEINRLVEAKRAKLSGLISREGACQIIASELGISFDKEKIKINELSDGMKKINLVGKIIRMFPVREYKKETREGKVANFIIADETGSARAVLWDINHIALIEQGKIKEGDVVEITNASLRNGEIHLTSFSDIKLSMEIIGEVKTTSDLIEKKIAEFKIGENVKARAIIVQAFEPRFFEVCPECHGKLIPGVDGSVCEKHGRVIGSKRALLSVILDDGTSNIRAVLFSEALEKTGFNMESLAPEVFLTKKSELLGKEAYFFGNIRQNKLFNNSEMFVSNIEEVDIDKLIESLERK